MSTTVDPQPALSPSVALPLPNSPLRTKGRWIVGDDGRVYIFHGVNMVNKLPPYTVSATGFKENSAHLLAQRGLNVVRVGVIYSAVEPAPGLYDDKYLTDIIGTINLLATYGVMSLIDFHQDGWGPSFICEGFPEWATNTGIHPIRPIGNFPALCENPAVTAAFTNLWNNGTGPNDNVSVQDRYAPAWAYAANAFKAVNDPNCILGFELINEPYPGSLPAPTTQLTDFYQKVVNAIRQVDTDHMIWYEPWVTFDAGFTTSVGPVNDPGPVKRIGFAFHNYMDYNKGNYDKVWQNALDQCDRTGDSLLVTEFGATTVADAITAEINSADAWMMPVIYWAYSNRTPYQIEVDGQLKSSTEQGLVYDPSLDLVAPNLSVGKMNAMTRVYPLIISGTPQSWKYNPNKTFNLTYTRIPESEIPPPAGPTVIFVPQSMYPSGFNVRVTGGSWSSTLNPQLVLVNNDPGAHTVSVDVWSR